MDDLVTKRVRLIRPDFNPALDGRRGTVVTVGRTPDTEGSVGVKLDSHYLSMEQAAEVAASSEADGRVFDGRMVWCEPTELEVISC